MTPKELRAVIWEISGGRCEWPQCAYPATQLAHIVSRGMGGGETRNTVKNAFAACTDHALVSDGQPPAGGGLEELRVELRKLTGFPLRGGKSLTMATRDWHPFLIRHLALQRVGLDG